MARGASTAIGALLHPPHSVEATRTRLILAAAGAGFVLLALGLWLFARKDDRAFSRDDTPLLSTGEMGLSQAYKTLKDGGRRVAFDPTSQEPPPRYAWWIVQPHLDWFTAKNARALKSFVEAGGIVVLAPEESVVQIGEEMPPPDGELDHFFKALDLDLHIVAFEPPGAEDDPDAPVDMLSDAIPDEDDPSPASITLPTSGSGERFLGIEELETSWGNYFDGESLLKAEIRVHSDGFPLIAEFNLGKGRLVLVAESTYFENEFIARSQNRSLLLALADTYGGRGIVMHQPEAPLAEP